MSRLTFVMAMVAILAASTLAWKNYQAKHALPGDSTTIDTPVDQSNNNDPQQQAMLHAGHSTSEHDSSQPNVALDQRHTQVESAPDENGPSTQQQFQLEPAQQPTKQQNVAEPLMRRQVLQHQWLARKFRNLSSPMTDGLADENVPSQQEPTHPEIERLPPLEMNEPGVSTNSQQFILPDEIVQQDIVLFAKGALKFRPPLGWSVTEMPYGREIRLVVALEPPVMPRQMSSDGMWIGYRLQTPSAGPANQETATQWTMQTRLALATDNQAEILQQSQINVGRWKADKVEFRIPGSNDTATSPISELRGYHLLIQTDWAMVELHCVTAVAQWQQRAKSFSEMISSLEINSPANDQQQPIASTSDSHPILGSWRAYRSLLQLLGDGRIVITVDPPSSQPLDAAAGYQPKDQLTGIFRAQGNLLFVTWRDGSKLNYRWRLDEGDLLMTDHQGQISQLRRVLK